MLSLGNELVMNGTCYNMTQMDYMVADLEVEPVPSQRRALQTGDTTTPSTTPITGTTPFQNLTSGENNTSFDAGIFIPVQVAGQIFNDLNANGILDPDEPLVSIAIIQVIATDSEGVPIPNGTNTMIVSSDGTYR